MNSQRRKSLIPKPSLSSLRSTKSTSSKTTPTNSPTKSIHSNNKSPPSSKIPLSNSKSNSSINSIFSNNTNRKRSSTSSTLDDYLSNLQSHISQDLETEKSALSAIILELDSRLSHYHQLTTKLKDLQKQEQKLNDTIFEYEIGIPVKSTLLDQESIKLDDELVTLKQKIEDQKKQYTKKIKHKEEKLIHVLKELVSDAEKDDIETVQIREKRLKELNDEKDQLLAEIGVAKKNMDDELTKFRKSFDIEKEETESKLGEVEKNLNSQLLELENQLHVLKEKNKQSENDYSNNLSQIESLQNSIKLKESQIEKLDFKLQDMKSLISELSLDLKNAVTLCSDFENGEYKTTKSNWLLAKSRLKQEKHKRLKIEIQIRELSGIPSIMIINNDYNTTIQNSKLNEFCKPVAYDWQSELFTSLEPALEGVSSLILHLSESESTNLNPELKSYLETLATQERFAEFQTTITSLPNLPSIDEMIKKDLDLPSSTTGLLIEMSKPNNSSSTKTTTRKSIALFVSLETSNELDDIRLRLSNLANSVQFLTVAENVSDSWQNSLMFLSALKPTRLRQACSFLNK